MLVRVLRVLTGYALACVAAAVTLVLFVYAPADLANLADDLSADRLSEAGYFALAITPYILVTAALPALLAAAFGEARKIVSWSFYALAGIATAAVGFLAQHLTEAPDRLSVFQAYALLAFLTSGIVGGLVYWATAGRHATAAAGGKT